MIVDYGLMGLEWNLRWRNGLFPWEEDQVSQLLEMISNKMPEMETTNRWVWKNSKTTAFSVKFTYGVLRGENGEEDSRMYKFFWRIKAIPSIHVTAWRVIKNKMASKVNMQSCLVNLESLL